jgi:hypothetical protein
MSAAYMINGHGFEKLHTCPIKLRAKEHVIMLCNWGCPLYVYNTFIEFIYKHIVNCKDSKELIRLLLDPTLKGKKYEKLKFIKDAFCQYFDIVPEMSFWYYGLGFRTGLHALPIITNPKVTAQVFQNDSVPVNYESYYSRPFSERLSDVIKKLRNINNKDGFTLVLFTCRDFTSELESIPLSLI